MWDEKVGFSSRAVHAPFQTMHLDFESGSFDGWSVKRLSAAHSAKIQSEVVRVGRRACRFELRPGDYVSQGHRAELRDPYNVVWDEEVWYGFSTRLAEDFSLPEGRLRLCPVARPGEARRAGGKAADRDPLPRRAALLHRRLGRVASPEPDIRYEFASIADFPRGHWHDFVVSRLLVASWHVGDRGLAEYGKDRELARAACLRERGGGALFQARRLLVAAGRGADRRLSRQL